ncbi:Outer membrane protein assembly factor BamB, contains PQQ-like beta-propeller repeat [Candidatus Kryptonium thompsonii]|uniref:Outer membrane protein assembly factor BamB, contains PQQ-like beta-propeller repeat n=1 Tax=Candidatus Kryptonium thompsonii TaxID=1633631 RepID=A0A0P1LCZ0_9BACT|nr:PQQ-binding-like beta-propeller repeat protein [Candidatus Kryptonium thompsoni]CUS79202.1 Outer membrane protein assembly factor BamB, contains PQQ-like beta-propeller repeat [Candidatus Kryptonium thompsoni]CUS82350.1 Outer membrane protein assembly factor BamB, contains PQQ-like beta-propeller repeat [Candidatus Kryptonium thompsoni]CUS82881.1 Outer membrane protein assembly factor BamB, contains PQQ-like beta-propeller repeat [Candidatus Kryptonium thompsoni]CUS83185.1 Outer membrane pro
MKKISIFLLLVFVSCSAFKLEKNIILGEFNWIQYGNSPENLNVSYFNISPPFQLTWKYNAGAGFSYAPMIVADGILFIATLNGEIHAVDIETGKKIGIIEAESAISATPVLYKNKIVIPTAHSKNTLQALDLNLGKVIWREKIGEIEASPLFIYDNLIVATIDSHVINYQIKYDIPQKIWEFKASKPIRSSPASDGNAIVFGCDDGNVYCIDFETGKLRWKFNTNSPIFAPVSIHKGKVFVGALNGTFYGLDLKNGDLKWKFQTNSKIYGGCAIKDSLLFFGTASGKFYALREKDGTVLWTFSAKSVINSAPLVSDNVVFIGSLDKNIYAIDITDGKLLWNYETGGRVKSTPVIWKNFIFVASEDRMVYAFKTQRSK